MFNTFCFLFKHHNIDFVKAVKKGATLYKDEEALSRMLGHKMTNSEPCIIYTPTKKQKRMQQAERD